MNWIDIAILAIVSLSIFLGIRKGFFSTFFSFLIIVAGFYGAGYVCHMAGGTIGENKIIQGAVFVFLFILFFILLSLMARFLRFLGSLVISGVANLIGGILLGLLRGLIVCVFLLFCAVLLDFDKKEILNKSKLAPKLLLPVKRVLSTPPDRLKDAFSHQILGHSEKHKAH